ncbi:MAG TPA: hypothetical protein VJ932_05240 [Alkalispirochaeta sp.]|nr:hypothetical protein [Alkalispirochaeta sp.]
MDDDGKMNENQNPSTKNGGSQSKDLVERSKQVFLREIVNEFRRKQEQYDVGVEFAKTRRNRSIMVPAVILGLIAVFAVVVIAVTQYIQQESRSIQVDIQDFADVNLRDILDEAERLQNELESARRELEQVRGELETRIGQVERARDREIQLLQEQELSSTQLNNRSADIESEAEAEIAALNEEYEPRIEEIQTRIADLQERIAEYDSRQLEQAREQQEVLDNQNRLHELEMQELRDEYEAQIEDLTQSYEREISELEQYQAEFEQSIRQRHANEIARLVRLYNPNLANDPVGELLGVPQSDAAAAFGAVGPYDSLLSQEGIISRSEFSGLQEQYSNVQRLLGRLQDVPYENSVPAALTQIEQRTQDLLAQYDDIRERLQATVIGRDEVIEERNETISQQDSRISEFLFALDQFARVNGDTGYIIDPRDEQNVVVYINRIRNVSVGSIGYVFRSDDEFVGTVRFEDRDGRITAQLIDTAEDKRLRAFDKVLIDVQ